MRLFICQACSQWLYFENKRCKRCEHVLGYIANDFELSALEPAENETWTALAKPGRPGAPATWRFCENAELDACNWLVPATSPDRYCSACRHNRTVPDLSDPKKMTAWRKMEVAKHRLIYQLTRLNLPLPNRVDDPQGGLVFDFLADPPGQTGKKILTGHDDGLITLALIEADDAERERRRTQMHEPYRTLLGHFRHEVGHYYWDKLVRDGAMLDECRPMFGDDEAAYAQALKTHYEQGAPDDWQANFVSTYATTHAWEDFAETWAHYLHIIDTLETAGAFGLEVHPTVTDEPILHADLHLDPYEAGNFDRLVAAWLPLTFAMNSMNRSMGLNDLYPFILSAPVIQKLSFIHDLVHRARAEVQQAA